MFCLKLGTTQINNYPNSSLIDVFQVPLVIQDQSNRLSLGYITHVIQGFLHFEQLVYCRQPA